jgi:hypothetical protein
MKLNSALAKRTMDQFDAQVIPDNHPAVPQLNSLFGDHTFFLNADGLSIVEPTETVERGARMGQIVNLADWRGPERSGLVPHEPEPTDTLVELDAERSDGQG